MGPVSAAICREQAHASLSRVTKEGRTLTYCMTVIQQPERARACGSGAKCKYPMPPSYEYIFIPELTCTYSLGR